MPRKNSQSRVVSTPYGTNSSQDYQQVIFHENNPIPATKREYTVYTKAERAVLESAFDQNPYPTLEKKQGLANYIGISAHQIQTWFENRRNRNRPYNDSKSPSKDTQHHLYQDEITVADNKRAYRRYLDDEIDCLEYAYALDPYPSRKMKHDLAERINVSEYHIKTWFENRRRKAKKEQDGSLLFTTRQIPFLDTHQNGLGLETTQLESSTTSINSVVNRGFFATSTSASNSAPYPTNASSSSQVNPAPSSNRPGTSKTQLKIGQSFFLPPLRVPPEGFDAYIFSKIWQNDRAIITKLDSNLKL